MVPMIWKQANVYAKDIGQDLIVHKLYVVWIVDQMAFVNRANAVVILVGQAIFAISYHAMPDVPNMVNARTALVYAHKDGMEDIALYLDVKTVVRDTVSALWRMANIDVIALKDGLVQIVQLHWK